MSNQNEKCNGDCAHCKDQFDVDPNDPRRVHAVKFINFIRTAPPSELDKLIVEDAGESLAQFFLAYSESLLNAQPHRVLENASSLFLMGYLVAKDELKEVN